MTVNKRTVGTKYEQKAADYLALAGYRLIEKNYRCRVGEIDLIAVQGSYLVFVEVKYRSDTKAGYGYEAVDWRKQKKIRRTALWYLTEKKIPASQPCRFDVVSFNAEEITLIQDAF